MIVTLCGSARFESWFHLWTEVLSLSGHLVFGLSSYPSLKAGKKEWYTPEQKKAMDRVHLAKIEASEGVLFLNVMAYLGESSLAELKYSKTLKKKIYFLESWGKGNGISYDHYEWLQKAAKAYEVGISGSPVNTFHPHGKDPYDLLPAAGSYRSALVDMIEERQKAALKGKT